MVESAGALLYRLGQQGSEVLLVHASGNFNRRAPWGIPKGLPDPGEELEAAARRETLEETGVRCGELVSLGSIVYQKQNAATSSDNSQSTPQGKHLLRARFSAA